MIEAARPTSQRELDTHGKSPFMTRLRSPGLHESMPDLACKVVLYEVLSNRRGANRRQTYKTQAFNRLVLNQTTVGKLRDDERTCSGAAEDHAPAVFPQTRSRRESSFARPAQGRP
jgi:hypothetical protein